VLSLLI
jgi:hypothetical protein